MRSSKSPIRFVASVHTATFRHPTESVRATFDRRRKQTTNHVKQRCGPPISMQNHREALRDTEVQCFKFTLQNRILWRKQDAIHYQEQHAQLSQYYEHLFNILQEPQKNSIKSLYEQKEQNQKTIEQEISRNCELKVGSSLLSLFTDFLIFQQFAALKARIEKMDLQGNHNLCGALGAWKQYVSMELLLMLHHRTHGLSG